MKRREFLKLAPAATLALSGCGLGKIDSWHVLVRSDVITSLEQERQILSKARLTVTDDGTLRVLVVRGTPYERGYQHGALLRTHIQNNLTYLYRRSVAKFQLEEMFYESFERMRPFIPDEYMDEMHGLAHGSKLPINVIHAIHALPSMTEWGGKKQIKKVIKDMMSGELATSCSNFCAFDSATTDSSFYAVRVLDWGLHRISKLHKYPLICVEVPESGHAAANVGWMGFIGAISGMNEKGITLGEMGYGDPPGETLRGKPMPFLLRDILSYASNLADVRRIIKESPGDNSFVYLMTDGKSRESEIYVRDRERFLVFRPGEAVKDRKDNFPPIKDVLYAGHYQDRMTKYLTDYRGKITPEVLMKEVIPPLVMPSNFQNVIYDPVKLRLWVSNAASDTEPAAKQPYVFFDLARTLEGLKRT